MTKPDIYETVLVKFSFFIYKCISAKNWKTFMFLQTEMLVGQNSSRTYFRKDFLRRRLQISEKLHFVYCNTGGRTKRKVPV